MTISSKMVCFGNKVTTKFLHSLISSPSSILKASSPCNLSLEKNLSRTTSKLSSLITLSTRVLRFSSDLSSRNFNDSVHHLPSFSLLTSSSFSSICAPFLSYSSAFSTPLSSTTPIGTKIRAATITTTTPKTENNAQQKQKVVVLGTGWASMNFFRHLDINLYEIIVISPRNYFTFTPFLPAACVGTLSPLACMEPVRNFTVPKKKLSLFPSSDSIQPSINFYEAYCTDIDIDHKRILCESVSKKQFKVDYDYLIIAVGTDTNTFNIKGVNEHAIFLKEIEHAVKIRRMVMNNFEIAALPVTTPEERSRLLSFVIVGGGPTGVESASEFADYIKEDMSKYFPELIRFVNITLIEGGDKVLPTFSGKVSEFALENMRNRLHINVLLNHTVIEVGPKTIKARKKIRGDSLSQASSQQSSIQNDIVEMPRGLVLWASGVAMVPLVKRLLTSLSSNPNMKTDIYQKHALPPLSTSSPSSPSSQSSSLLPALKGLPVTPQFRVYGLQDVYALGDCSVLIPPKLSDNISQFLSRLGGNQPSLQWLEKESKEIEKTFPQISKFNFQSHPFSQKGSLTKDEFLDVLESIDKGFKPPPPTAQVARQEGEYLADIFNQYTNNGDREKAPAFCEKWNGSLAYVGNSQAVGTFPFGDMTGGIFSLTFWKIVYMQMQMTWRNRAVCLFDWMKTTVTGRDVGRDHQFYS